MARPAPRAASKPTPLGSQRPEVLKIRSLLQRRPLALGDYYAIGKQLHLLRGDVGGVGSRGSHWRHQVARLAGVSAATLNKCLQFYDRYEKNPRPALQQLKKLQVGWAHLTFALAVKDSGKRLRLLRRAVAEGWSGQEVRREVQRLNGSNRGGGRRRKAVRGYGLLPDLSELVRLTRLWATFHDDVWAPGRKAYAGELRKVRGTAPARLKWLLEQAAGDLQALQEQCREAAEIVEDLRDKLG